MYIPPWIGKSEEHLGVHELVGPGSNPVILAWRESLKPWARAYFTDDDIAWCALAVNGILHEVGIAGPGTLAAKDFAGWGQDAREHLGLGCVLVFTRPGGGGHVGFYIGERPDAFLVRGGNQGNKFCDTWIARARLIAVRWPPGLELPYPSPVILAADGRPVSVNEG